MKVGRLDSFNNKSLYENGGHFRGRDGEKAQHVDKPHGAGHEPRNAIAREPWRVEARKPGPPAAAAAAPATATTQGTAHALNSDFQRNTILAIQALGPRAVAPASLPQQAPPPSPQAAREAPRPAQMAPAAPDPVNPFLHNNPALQRAFIRADTSNPVVKFAAQALAGAASQSAPTGAVQTAPPAAPGNDAVRRQSLAGEMARDHAYRLDASGTQSPLDPEEQLAIAQQLSQFSVGQLNRLNDKNVGYVVVDPYHTPPGMTWDMKEAAFYDPDLKSVFISQYRLDGTVIHETAHALDNVMAQGTQFSSQASPGLRTAYQDYAQRVHQAPSSDWDAQYQAYAATNVLEFTAEATRMYLQSDATRTQLHALDPETYQAIGAFLGAASVA